PKHGLVGERKRRITTQELLHALDAVARGAIGIVGDDILVRAKCVRARGQVGAKKISAIACSPHEPTLRVATQELVIEQQGSLWIAKLLFSELRGLEQGIIGHFIIGEVAGERLIGGPGLGKFPLPTKLAGCVEGIASGLFWGSSKGARKWAGRQGEKQEQGHS